MVYCMMCVLLTNSMYVIFFFFKQKTAYEMRISDCSSDVCSSDLQNHLSHHRAPLEHRKALAPVGEVEHRMDMRPDATLGGKRVDRRNILRAAFGKAPAIFARAHPDDREALDQRPVDRNLRNPSRRETDDE